MTKYHVGIDLHKHVAQVCVLNADGEVQREFRTNFSTPAEALAFVELLRPYAKDGRFAVESLGVSRWFVEACRDRDFEVVTVDAFKLALRKAGKKTDRRDAQEIARRLYLGDIDRNARSYHATADEHAVRRLTRVRHFLREQETALSNQIGAILAALNLGRPKGADLATKPSLQWLRAQRLEPWALQSTFDALVNCLESIHRQVCALDAAIRKLPALASDDSAATSEPGPASAAPGAAAASTPGIASEPLARRPLAERIAVLVRELPSVAAQTAATIAAELGDVTRFRSARAVASYAGLVPRVANSADVSHHGALTKRGSEDLRWILSQWAVRLLQDPRVNAWAKPRLRRTHLNKVRMALARRLLVGVYVMLRDGQTFSLERCLATKAA
jgi:transposase